MDGRPERARMPPEGLEHHANPAGKTRVPDSGGSKSGSKQAGVAFGTLIDADLGELVELWSRLSPLLRQHLLAIVRTAAVASSKEQP